MTDVNLPSATAETRAPALIAFRGSRLHASEPYVIAWTDRVEEDFDTVDAARHYERDALHRLAIARVALLEFRRRT